MCKLLNIIGGYQRVGVLRLRHIMALRNSFAFAYLPRATVVKLNRDQERVLLLGRSPGCP